MKNVTSYILFLFLFTLSPVFSQQKSEKLKKEQAQLEKQIQATKSLLETTKKGTEKSFQELQLTEQNIRFREQLLENIDQQIKATDNRIQDIESSIVSLNTKIESLKEQYRAMVFYAYKKRNKYDRIMFIFSSDNFNQAYKRMVYLEKIKEIRLRQVLLIRQNQDLLAKESIELNDQKQESLKLASTKRAEREALIADKENQQQLYNEFKSRENELLTKLREEERKKAALQAEIQKAIARELEEARKKAEAERLARERAAKEKAEKEGGVAVVPKENVNDAAEKFGLTPEARLIGTDFTTNKGKLPYPVESGTITEKFGKNPHPTVPHIYTYNNGVDISTAKGANVRAVFQGEVTSVLSIPGAGKVVIIKHGNYRTVYSNLQDVYVDKGTKISVKQVIGTLLPQGNISIAHFEIHEVKANSVEKLNPSYWLSN
ncbi:peptidoglycan DD-metalloendopeptidase family protein [Wandonia haliotis]|uniref:Peptidoglycan DD-metalloendopeptidase family protein n=1 Tax=Wandonia haliotis TaxID=574963 RepID=A0ABN1MLU5_9FLAO